MPDLKEFGENLWIVNGFIVRDMGFARPTFGHNPRGTRRPEMLRESADRNCLRRQWCPQERCKLRGNLIGHALQRRVRFEDARSELVRMCAQIVIDVRGLHGDFLNCV